MTAPVAHAFATLVAVIGVVVAGPAALSYKVQL